MRHQGELFQFVRVPGLSADNNAADRMLRPLVITRKISGGSRTPEGTEPVDYARVRQILEEVGYNGYVSIEYEEKEDASTAVPRFVEYLKGVFRG